MGGRIWPRTKRSGAGCGMHCPQSCKTLEGCWQAWGRVPHVFQPGMPRPPPGRAGAGMDPFPRVWGWRRLASGQSLSFAKGLDGQVVREHNSCGNRFKSAQIRVPGPATPETWNLARLGAEARSRMLCPSKPSVLRALCPIFSAPGLILWPARRRPPGLARGADGPVGRGFGLAGYFFRPIPIVFSRLGVVCGPGAQLAS